MGRHEAYSKMNMESSFVSSESKPSHVVFAAIHVLESERQSTDSFKSETVICFGIMTIGISNSISDTLLKSQ